MSVYISGSLHASIIVFFFFIAPPWAVNHRFKLQYQYN